MRVPSDEFSKANHKHDHPADSLIDLGSIKGFDVHQKPHLDSSLVSVDSVFALEQIKSDNEPKLTKLIGSA